MNGFRFWADPNAAEWQRREPRQRRFVVQHPDGRHQEVIVEFDCRGHGRSSNAPRRIPFQPRTRFGLGLPNACLNAFLWNEGNVPPGGKLTIEAKAIDRDTLQMAMRWGNKD